MNYRMLKYTLGLILIFEAAFFLVPTVTAICYGEWWPMWSFVITAGICLGVGIFLSFKKPANMKLYAKDGFVIVSLSWIIISLFGALPFVISGAIPSYIDALFETVSGFTTTGSSILSDVEALPKSVLIWRSFTHWIGGMGVLVFVMAILPLSGARNMHIMRAESPGPEVSKLVPRVRKTALILYAIYFALTVITFLFLVVDMSVFEALNPAFSVAGTGGFGFRNDSMNSFSPYVKIICTVFMLLFSVNFNSYYLILKGKLKDAFNSEVRVFFLIVLIAGGIITANLLIVGQNGADTLGDALLNSFFTVASLVSTTGFSTLDFNLWPSVSQILLLLVMFVGACAGSTGGGFKVSRIVILLKGVTKEVRTQLNPREIKKITIDKRPVEHEVIRTVNAYLVTYFLIFVTSFLLVCFDSAVISGTGNALVTNFTAVLATFNNVGPGLEMVGPTSNFGFYSPFSKIVFIFTMLAGRLELFPMLLLFNLSTWKK